LKHLPGNLSHNNLWQRAGYAFLYFFAFLALSYGFGFLVLPEGIMKELPIPALMVFQEEESFFSLFTKTSLYNSFVLLIIIGTNHYRVRSLTFGYFPLYANTVIMELFAGTNSFSGGVSTYTLDGWLLFLQIGFLEFSAYILACAATVRLAMFHSERWRGEKFKKIRGFKEVRLSKLELLFLLISFGLLAIAAVNEWKYISL
jgi:hypothetical protein